MMELTAKLSPETHRIIDGGLTLDVQIVPQFISMLRQELIFFESEPDISQLPVELKGTQDKLKNDELKTFIHRMEIRMLKEQYEAKLLKAENELRDARDRANASEQAIETELNRHQSKIVHLRNENDSLQSDLSVKAIQVEEMALQAQQADTQKDLQLNEQIAQNAQLQQKIDEFEQKMRNRDEIENNIRQEAEEMGRKN